MRVASLLVASTRASRFDSSREANGVGDPGPDHSLRAAHIPVRLGHTTRSPDDR